jgi:hypothetical protein
MGDREGQGRPRFGREGETKDTRRRTLLENVEDVREVIFLLLDRARNLDSRQTAVVDALQLVANDLGGVEAILREPEHRSSVA